MVDKKTKDLIEQFEELTIKRQMKILAHKAAKSKLYFKETMDEFEKTLLQAIIEKYDYNLSKVSLNIKLHRNTIANKMTKYKIKEKKRK